MTIVRRLAFGLALAITTLMPLAAARADQVAAASFSGAPADRRDPSRVCIDMDGHFFAWKWGNAPFASSCIEAPAKKTPTFTKVDTCYAECSTTSLGCLTSLQGSHEPTSCTNMLDACMAGCTPAAAKATAE